MLREGFEGREAALEELRTSGVLLCDFLRGPEKSFLCLVQEPKANVLRDGWAEAAFADGLSWAMQGSWQGALDSATRAFVLERAMSPERIALLTLAYEHCGRPARAEGYLEMARRSRGEDFAAKILDRQQELRRRTKAPESVPDSSARPICAPEIHQARKRHIKAGLERLRSRRPA